ncbi:YbaB/EbfC family nucleoid-associated protein [Nocardia amikacinitolerans]|uniref:YbaB/EbfC family nucleoid-associated protein n=1 Tax=Nocardia amikacinitolerans TaxID=756689 RepID=UPI003555F126
MTRRRNGLQLLRPDNAQKQHGERDKSSPASARASCRARTLQSSGRLAERTFQSALSATRLGSCSRGVDLGDQGPAAARIERLQDAMTRARGRASSSDDSVTVVVGANGVLHAITVSDSSTLTARRLADVVVELHKLAFARAGDAVREAVEQLDGAGSADDAAGSRGDTGLRDGADSETPDASSGSAAHQEVAAHSRSGSRADIGRSSATDTAQDDPMHHVIQPFAGPDDDDYYFTATSQHPRPHRPPLPVATSTPDPDMPPPLSPRCHLTIDPPTRNLPSPPAPATHELPVAPGWPDPLLPDIDSDGLYPLDDPWDDSGMWGDANYGDHLR